jgi:Fe2+ or Zn2+ uptake regulation protein
VTERRTRQLEAVYETVCKALDHPTAEQVYTRVRRRIPSVSLGTVYRNLQKLAAQQRLRVLHLGDRVARYDVMLAPHDHFVCERCATVTDIVQKRRAPADCSHLQRAGFSVRAQDLTFYGICPHCRARTRPARLRAARV